MLKHKFVVEFLGISFRSQNEMVLVIELMQHGNLRDLLDRKGDNLPWKLRLRLLKDAAKGMYVALDISSSLSHAFDIPFDWRLEIGDWRLEIGDCD